jgi:hypothetical protein
MPTAVNVGLKKGPLIGNFPERSETEYLVASRIGKNVMLPGRETVKAAERRDDIHSRAQKKVIRIAQDETISHPVKGVMANGLYGTAGTYRHKRRSLYIAMGQMKYSRSGTCGISGGCYGKELLLVLLCCCHCSLIRFWQYD